MKYGVFLLPFAILTGPFVPDLLISLIAVLFLNQTVKNKEWGYFLNYFSLFFLTFCIYLIINSLLSDFIYQSLSSSLFYFRFGLFSLAVWYVIGNNKNFKKFFYYIIFYILIRTCVRLFSILL